MEVFTPATLGVSSKEENRLNRQYQMNPAYAHDTGVEYKSLGTTSVHSASMVGKNDGNNSSRFNSEPMTIYDNVDRQISFKENPSKEHVSFGRFNDYEKMDYEHQRDMTYHMSSEDFYPSVDSKGFQSRGRAFHSDDNITQHAAGYGGPRRKRGRRVVYYIISDDEEEEDIYTCYDPNTGMPIEINNPQHLKELYLQEYMKKNPANVYAPKTNLMRKEVGHENLQHRHQEFRLASANTVNIEHSRETEDLATRPLISKPGSVNTISNRPGPEGCNRQSSSHAFSSNPSVNFPEVINIASPDGVRQTPVRPQALRHDETVLQGNVSSKQEDFYHFHRNPGNSFPINVREYMEHYFSRKIAFVSSNNDYSSNVIFHAGSQPPSSSNGFITSNNSSIPSVIESKSLPPVDKMATVRTRVTDVEQNPNCGFSEPHNHESHWDNQRTSYVKSETDPSYNLSNIAVYNDMMKHGQYSAEYRDYYANLVHAYQEHQAMLEQQNYSGEESYQKMYRSYLPQNRTLTISSENDVSSRYYDAQLDSKYLHSYSHANTPNFHSVIDSELINSIKSENEKVSVSVLRNACEQCFKAKAACDFIRPCSRCIRRNIADQCTERTKILRKFGRPPAARSCLRCSKSRIRCDNSRPCQNCTRKGWKCEEKPTQTLDESEKALMDAPGTHDSTSNDVMTDSSRITSPPFGYQEMSSYREDFDAQRDSYLENRSTTNVSKPAFLSMSDHIHSDKSNSCISHPNSEPREEDNSSSFHLTEKRSETNQSHIETLQAYDEAVPRMTTSSEILMK